MIRLNQYINEELQINEGLLILCLLGAVATHFAVKAGKKCKKYGDNFWGWALGEKEISMSNASESLNESEDNKKKFDKSKVQPAQIEKDDILKKVIEKTEPESSEKSKKGFYVFQNLLKENPELGKINKAPYFANYVLFMDPGDKDHEDQKPNFYGMLGFSVKYWSVVAKKGKDEKIKEVAKNYTKYLNIFAVQSDPQYVKQGLFDIYLDTMKNAAKELHMDGITIKYDNDKLVEVFKKYGFEKIEDLDNYMMLPLKVKKEDKEGE